jgi:hypothetical protein
MYRPSDILLLDTKYGVVHWQACPEEILASASPGPSFGYDSEEEEGEDQNSDTGNDADGDADSNADSDVDSDDELEWGPCWPVSDFFEMLKNQFRDLNFVPKNNHQIVDVWTTTHYDGHPIPSGIPELLQPIYRKHGWPNLQAYRKEECLEEVERVLKEKFPNHHQYHR